MRARFRALFDGTGWFVGPAVVLLVFAAIVIFLEFQSPDIVLWTGTGVTGTEQGGIVAYSWRGQNYTVDAPGYGSSKAVAVYLDPANPANAMIDSALSRATVGGLVGGPLAGAAVLLGLGLSRGYRQKRRELRRGVSEAAYGHGLDPEFVAQHLERLRHPGQDAE